MEKLSRRFFQDSALAKSVTGVETLTKQFNVVLRTLTCGYAINVENFKNYALNTAKLNIELYPWYYMPSMDI